MRTKQLLAAVTALAVVIAAGVVVSPADAKSKAATKTTKVAPPPQYTPIICGIFPFMCKKEGKHTVIK